MLTFTAREAKNRLGEVFRAAESETVEITNHGKPIVRIISIKNSESIQKSVASNHAQAMLDQIKFRISCEILARFSVDQIRKKSFENLTRWKENGSWSLAYDDWMAILEKKDDRKLIASMIGFDERSNQLRQSMPYVGLLDKSTVRKINEEVAG